MDHLSLALVAWFGKLSAGLAVLYKAYQRFAQKPRVPVRVHPEALEEAQRDARLRLAARERSADVQHMSNHRRNAR